MSSKFKLKNDWGRLGMKSELRSLCSYAKGKVSVDTLSKRNYVSTENMLPNKGGIVDSGALPSAQYTQQYIKGDILVSNIRPYFKKIWMADDDGGCSNDVLVFRAERACDSTFLYYVLANDEFFNYASATAKGTKMPRGDKTAIMQYEVPCFDLETQLRIGKLLRCIDYRIAINKKINDNLQQQAYAYFVRLFVENADPTWRIGTISDLGTVVGGGTPSKSKSEYYIENGIAWITPKDLSVDKSKFIAHGENDISELGYRNSSATMMPAGTVLFSSRAPIGYIAIASNDVTTNQGFKSVVPHPEIGTPFVYYFLIHNLPLIESKASGSTFKEVSGSVMKSVEAVIPDGNTIAKFNEFCRPIFAMQEKLEQENRKLAEMRDSLLPLLMNGEIDVADIDA